MSRMGSNRDFSDSIKLEVIKNNLKKNNGSICCETCKAKLNSIDECHFDHIYPFAKGGKSTFDNCQILCSDCNLRKNDKELQDFMIEEKAKQFLSGVQLNDTPAEIGSKTTAEEDSIENNKQSTKLTKAEFDAEIKRFIDRKGDIHKIDFTRAYNKLPSVWYVREYYGDLNTLKKAFGIEDLSQNWTRENIKQALLDYVSIHGDVCQKDLKKKNKLPSYPCILKYYSEYKSFSVFKQEVLGITDVYKVWTKEEALAAGKAFVINNGSLSEKDLKSKNGLPTAKVIYSHFGTLSKYQELIGSKVNKVNELITRQQIIDAVNQYFGNKERIINSRQDFLKTFPYSASSIHRLFGPFLQFCADNNITVLNAKIASYSKKEIDDAIHSWVFSGKDIPKSTELTKWGLPSMSSIMKYYENWKEPFVLYKKIYDEANRNKL